jgi:ribosomal protein L34E
MQHTVEVDIQVQTMKHYLFDSCLRSKNLDYCLKSLKNRRKNCLQRCSHTKYKPNRLLPGINTAQSATEFVVSCMNQQPANQSIFH